MEQALKAYTPESILQYLQYSCPPLGVTINTSNFILKKVVMLSCIMQKKNVSAFAYCTTHKKMFMLPLTSFKTLRVHFH
jgi:hypothetical protein